MIFKKIKTVLLLTLIQIINIFFKKIFTDILYLAIINEAPLPLYMDPIIFCFIFDEIENITLEDINRHDRVIYDLTMSIKNANPNQDLDYISGFKDWAEDNNFQV